MLLGVSDYHLIEKIYKGDSRAFTSLYEKCRSEFYGFFDSMCVQDRFANQSMMRFKEGNYYLDDLYQTSCLKMYNQIMTGKMFVSNGCIYIKGKDGSINQLKANLKTYLTSIGKLTLKEYERGERRYVDFDAVERIAHDDDINDILETPATSSKTNIDPIVDLSTDPYFDNEDRATLVRRIVSEMESPCKEIFTYTYFGENGKKMKGEQIAQIMGYASADVVKNQKSRCHKKFKAKYIQETVNL